MLRLVVLIALASLPNFAAAHPHDPLDDVLSSGCAPWQDSITGVSGQRQICFTADGVTPTPLDGPRFGCPLDWILVQRGDTMVSCSPKTPAPQPPAVVLPEPAPLCGPSQTIYYRLSGPACAPTNVDAGQTCTGALDCDGECLGDTRGEGICSAGPLSFGCTDFLNVNGDPMAICID